MTSAFYSKAQGVVITFSVAQRSSFEALGSWIRDVREVPKFFHTKYYYFIVLMMSKFIILLLEYSGYLLHYFMCKQD